MEQVDLQLIKLSGILKDKGKLAVYIKRTTVRDFRIKTTGIGNTT